MTLRNGKMDSIPINDVAGRIRTVTPDCDLVSTASSLWICLGFPMGADPAAHYEEVKPARRQQ